jgi:5-methylcytosine-specific restriction endonuclease McrA
MKVCTKCKEEKPLEEFSKNSNSSDGRQYQCKVCKAAYRASKAADIAAHRKVYYAANKEKIAAYSKKYAKENKEAIAITKKLYSASVGGRKNRHEARSKREEHIANTSDGSITKQSLDDLMVAQEGKCAICSCDLDALENRYVHMDHILPIAKGGEHKIGNIQWTCSSCNLTKSDRVPPVLD